MIVELNVIKKIFRIFISTFYILSVLFPVSETLGISFHENDGTEAECYITTYEDKIHINHRYNLSKHEVDFNFECTNNLKRTLFVKLDYDQLYEEIISVKPSVKTTIYQKNIETKNVYIDDNNRLIMGFEITYDRKMENMYFIKFRSIEEKNVLKDMKRCENKMILVFDVLNTNQDYFQYYIIDFFDDFTNYPLRAYSIDPNYAEDVDEENYNRFNSFIYWVSPLILCV